MKSKNPADIFVSILRDKRTDMGLSQEQLAKQLGLQSHVIPEWESGKRYPRLATALKWAHALGVKIELRGHV